MSKRRIGVLVVAGAVLLPLLAVAAYTATTKWVLAGPPDECDLIPRTEVEQILQAGEVEIASRHARPGTAGGWHYSCSYERLTAGEDHSFLSVTVLTGALARVDDFVDLLDGQSRHDAKPLPGPGEDAWVSDRGAGMRVGDTIVRVTGGADDAPVAPDKFESALRAVSGRLSTVPEFPQAEMSGVCERLDVALMERHAGTKLPVRRGNIRENGDVTCRFSSSDATFAVNSTTDEEQVDIARERSSTGTPVAGLPVKTARSGWEPGDAMLFVVGERRYEITFVPDGDGPLPDKTELPKMVVDAFEDCGDALAGC